MCVCVCMYACRQSLPVPSDLRQGLQVLHDFLPTGWLPYSWLSMSTPFVLNVLLLAQQTQLGAGSLYFCKLFYCQRRHESDHRNFGFQAKMFTIFKIKF